jgi:two-component system response regulator VicR
MQGLVVEDNRDVAYIASFALQQLGYETETLFNGSDALKYLESHVPDVLVLDLQLPHINGQEIIAYLRGEVRFFQTIVVVMTAHEHLVDHIKDDVSLVLKKPVRFKALQAFLQSSEPGD